MRFIAFLYLVMIALQAAGQAAFLEKSDERAVKLMENLKKDYERSGSHKITFELDIELPGQPVETQAGYIIQEGEKFVLDLADQKIISDNKTVWVYLRDLNEIQINDADFNEEDNFLSPATVFRMTETDDYIFALSATNEVEAKPLDRDSDFSKIRISLGPKGETFDHMKIFSKDGSRYTLRLIKHVKNFKTDKSTFVMNPAEYKGVYVEDLRF